MSVLSSVSYHNSVRDNRWKEWKHFRGESIVESMPWQPFRRKNKYRQVEEPEAETSFDDLLPRSVSDGNLVRLANINYVVFNH